MFCEAWPDLKYFIFTSHIPLLIYYSHLPTMVISLIMGIFVYAKNRTLLGKLLFAISIIFSIWIAFDLILWVNPDSRLLMLLWSVFGLLYGLIFILSLYFVYVFIDKKDVTLTKKIVFSLLLLPIFLFTPTQQNLKYFDVTVCTAKEGQYFTNYYYAIGLFIFLWVLFLVINRYRKAEHDFKKQIIYLAIGVEFFIFSLFVTGFLASYLVEVGLFKGFDIDQYGLFGVTFFMGMLVYLIVKYKAFNIKLFGAQALVVTLVILVGSQFAFVQNTTGIVLTGITLALVLGFGYVLIKSVKKEVEQREALEIANKEINERKEQLQLMTDSLAQANDQLRKLDNAKTEFISIASHQLRTPVTAIKGFASLLLEGSYGEISAAVKGALEKMYISSERLVNLIEDLLNVSRIESGRLTFTFENASVEKILKELYENFLLIAKSKKFYLDLKLPEVPFPEIKMDAGKIRELVSNFIDNALKYTEKGGVTISAEIKESGTVIDDHGFVKEGEKSPFGKVVRITVSDTGIGIPREEIPFLFRKFSRGKDVSRLHVSGTGLGLFVGKAIADAHHGATWVESDGAGMGSRFIIEIPIEGQMS